MLRRFAPRNDGGVGTRAPQGRPYSVRRGRHMLPPWMPSRRPRSPRPRRDPPAPLVRIRNLHLTVPSAAGPVNILRGIDLDIARGEAVGPGRPLRVRQDQPADGARRAGARHRRQRPLAGHEVTALDEDALARLRREHVGIVFQAFHLIPTMTALENVAVPLELAGRADADGPRARGAARGRPGPPADPPARPAFRRRAAAHRPGAGLRRPSRCCCWPTSRPATWTTPPAPR